MNSLLLRLLVRTEPRLGGRAAVRRRVDAFLPTDSFNSAAGTAATRETVVLAIAALRRPCAWPVSTERFLIPQLCFPR